jgi:hypothetical protein
VAPATGSSSTTGTRSASGATTPWLTSRSCVSSTTTDWPRSTTGNGRWRRTERPGGPQASGLLRHPGRGSRGRAARRSRSRSRHPERPGSPSVKRRGPHTHTTGCPQTDHPRPNRVHRTVTPTVRAGLSPDRNADPSTDPPSVRRRRRPTELSDETARIDGDGQGRTDDRKNCTGARGRVTVFRVGPRSRAIGRIPKPEPGAAETPILARIRVRVLWLCWRDHTLYDPAHHRLAQALIAVRAPLTQGVSRRSARAAFSGGRSGP